VTDECEHGDPRPGRCALCRQRVKEQTQPWRYRDTTAPTTTGVPKPIWFDALVEEAKEQR
jgi:hypothetical protein